LLTQAIDFEHGSPVGTAEPIADSVAFDDASFYASIAASTNGMLTYAAGASSGRPLTRLTWLDRSGRSLSTVGDPGPYTNLSLSWNERQAAVSLVSGTPPNRDIWLIDLAHPAAMSRFTFDRGDDALPTWSPDGDRLIFNSRRRQFYELYQKPSDGSAAEVRILEQSSNVYPTSWSRDGRFLVYATDSPNSAADLSVLLTGDRKPIPFVRTPAAENHGSFAPDGRWI